MPVDFNDAALHSSLHRTAKVLGIKLPDSPGNHRDMVPFILEEMANRLVKSADWQNHGDKKLTAQMEKPHGRTTKRR